MSVNPPKKVKDSPVDPFKEGMTPEESSNYDNLRASKKKNPGWTPGEARGLATNPMDRLPPLDTPKAKSRADRLYQNK